MKIVAPRIIRAKWSSERAFILATAAAAVGLGNLWRFPYMTGENGGAAFIMAYIIAVFTLGIPLMLIELNAGKFANGGVVKTFRTLKPYMQWFGWLIVLLTITIMSYYLVITGWTLGYAIDSLSGSIKPFSTFTSGYASLYYFLIVCAITGFVVVKGVKLIELLSKIFMPLLVIIILFLTGYSITLPQAPEAFRFLFSPDFSSFLSPSLWALAFGQAFYSLSIGQGYLITYGSFISEGINLPRATSIIAIFETSVALIAGLMIFPIVFTFGLNPAQGSELAFSTLPIAFANIPIGAILAVGFFWLFFLAAISSCIAGMEVIKTTLREEMRLTHIWATIASFLLILPMGILSALSFSKAEFTFSGRPFLEILDMFAANQLLIVLGLIGGAFIAWTIPLQPVVNSFSNRFRHYGTHIIIATRYLWIFVLLILIVSFLL